MIYSIYKISIKETDFVYVGSTTDINRRQKEHKLKVNQENLNSYNYKIYKTIRENGGWDNCVMEVLENIECANKNEANKQEQEWIDKLKCNLNSFKAYTNLTKNERDKIYNYEHKEQRKEYRENNKDKILEYNHKYKEENHDKLLDKAKAYREKIPEKIQANNKKQMEMPPILCECGLYYTYTHKLRHMKSKTHINRIDPSTIINNKLCKYCSKEISHCNRIRHEKTCQENNNELS
jgi:hypothetical protein